MVALSQVSIPTWDTYVKLFIACMQHASTREWVDKELG